MDGLRWANNVQLGVPVRGAPTLLGRSSIELDGDDRTGRVRPQNLRARRPEDGRRADEPTVGHLPRAQGATRAPDTKYGDYVKPKEQASPRGAYSVPSTNHPPDDLIDDLSEEEID